MKEWRGKRPIGISATFKTTGVLRKAEESHLDEVNTVNIMILIFTFLDFFANFMYLFHLKLKKLISFLSKERILG
jgi:hypothetical protein